MNLNSQFIVAFCVFLSSSLDVFKDFKAEGGGGLCFASLHQLDSDMFAFLFFFFFFFLSKMFIKSWIISAVISCYFSIQMRQFWTRSVMTSCWQTFMCESVQRQRLWWFIVFDYHFRCCIRSIYDVYLAIYVLHVASRVGKYTNRWFNVEYETKLCLIFSTFQVFRAIILDWSTIDAFRLDETIVKVSIESKIGAHLQIAISRRLLRK